MIAMLKGKPVEVSQWANDWVSLEDGRIVSPSSLMYDAELFMIMTKDKNNGMLLEWFEPVSNIKRGVGKYNFTFRRRK